MSVRLPGRRSSLAWGLALLVAAWLGALATSVRAEQSQSGTDEQREAGRALYMKDCSQCHGEKGDGEGIATPHLRPRPRDFTQGKFKVRTTPNGALPTHQDLVNIIRHGMPYTSMPAWTSLSDQDVSNLAYFITTFSPDFSNPDKVPTTVPLPGAPASSAASIELGRKLYTDTGCARCHGTLGRGDGPSAPALKDDWNQPIRPADLTERWTFRGGPSREDIFRTLSTGFNGTPMPSFLDALTPEQRWALTDFIVSLSGSEGPDYANLVVARHVDDPIDLANATATFASAPVARFPIVGQVMEPVRSFHPPASSVTVQAVYDAESIAFLVRWHDMSAQKEGKNGPTLAVPPEEEEEQGTSGGGIWGEAEAAPAEVQDPFAEATEPAVPPSEFSDAVAVQTPMQALTGARKPYFIFGDAQDPVDLWFFDLARTAPQQFTARGSADIAANDTGDVTGVASYDQGEWSVVFKRPLQATAGAAFAQGQFLPIAFSVWDGLSRERGNRRGLTVWQWLYVEPEVVPSAVGPMVRTAAIIVVVELMVIGLVRRRYRVRREDLAQGRPQTAAGA
jgi:mono/diheme cytochrome c family protein